MKKLSWRRVCLLAALVLGGCPLAWAAESAPNLKLKDLDGQSQNLKQYRGKITVLNYWATWCGPCQEEMPLFAQEEQAYRNRGVVFVGVSMDDPKDIAKVRAYVAKVNAQYPIWLGTVDDLERFKLGPGIPATAFINADGEIVGRVLGEIHKPDLEHRIEWLLGNRQGEPPVPIENNLNVKH
jgi:thiol-disulfide isomerase/thioredoxin